ncbi:hypothetical protein [Sphingosinicella sp. BN140058]|uniref:hypothetical protein n=1 Tax=Sphingosinicella sp. BN140058 TaxID=1892855 RepID=UPI001010E0BA|nr:hypothetical protein [Sphingosinicella sp. BN140058]QAY78206.1 hypothetical protein ETR14_17970 [Sphingosinicella sp. BN140058]
MMGASARDRVRRTTSGGENKTIFDPGVPIHAAPRFPSNFPPPSRVRGRADRQLVLPEDLEESGSFVRAKTEPASLLSGGKHSVAPPTATKAIHPRFNPFRCRLLYTVSTLRTSSHIVLQKR